MAVRFLENKGSGNILEISRARLLELTPNVYPLTWEAILSGNGDSAAILGAGFAEREVFFGFEGVDLTRYQLPTIDCYDIATNPPEKFLALRSQYPNLQLNYFCDRNLTNLELTKLYPPKTLRLVSVHGVLDYLQPDAVIRSLYDIVMVQPEAISVRLFLIGNPWSWNFATVDQLATELKSIEIATSGSIEPIDFDVFCRTGIIQLDISSEDKIAHNLLPTYGASHVMPDKLVGYLTSQGYQLIASDVYSLTNQDLQGDKLHNYNMNEDAYMNYPHGILLFFKQ
ncbi:hypothetical protein PI95_004325 [Hassallia byssoidea VB512170]|uniref:Uncharacterized protein n=1 Tax=Hassallia byssoidea VB512170 TaxID=1304833 RepID=A0A846H5F1_9CYAN|nr:hypothetical protein [Hassalia byssoidea]NEU71821.1 hypothetical protein [Hassalia byssoidea VB512170]